MANIIHTKLVISSKGPLTAADTWLGICQFKEYCDRQYSNFLFCFFISSQLIVFFCPADRRYSIAQCKWTTASVLQSVRRLRLVMLHWSSGGFICRRWIEQDPQASMLARAVWRYKWLSKSTGERVQSSLSSPICSKSLVVRAPWT